MSVKYLTSVLLVTFAGNALAQAPYPTPTPVLKKSPQWTAPTQGTPAMRPYRSAYQSNWSRFQGATRCEQPPGQPLVCDNGYKSR